MLLYILLDNFFLLTFCMENRLLLAFYPTPLLSPYLHLFRPHFWRENRAFLDTFCCPQSERKTVLFQFRPLKYCSPSERYIVLFLQSSRQLFAPHLLHGKPCSFSLLPHSPPLPSPHLQLFPLTPEKVKQSYFRPLLLPTICKKQCSFSLYHLNTAHLPKGIQGIQCSFTFFQTNFCSSPFAWKIVLFQSFTPLPPPHIYNSFRSPH